MKRNLLILFFVAVFSPLILAEGQADRKSEQGYGENMMHAIEMIHAEHGPTASGMADHKMRPAESHPRRQNSPSQGRAHYEEFNDKAQQRKRLMFEGNH